MKNNDEKVQYLRKLAIDWKDYAKHLQTKLDMATGKLRDISVGLVPTKIADESKWDSATKTQYSAATMLKDLAQRDGPKEPDYNFYP